MMMATHCKINNTRILVILGIGTFIFTMGYSAYLLHASVSRTIKMDKFRDSYKNGKIDKTYKEVLQELKLLSENSTGTQEIFKEKNFMRKIVYNRVGKCGSRSMLTTINRLSKLNDFMFYQSPTTNRAKIVLDELIEEARIINNLPTPSIYSRHIHYIEFVKFGMLSPVYINMIRDPIERFSSQYHFARYGDNNKAEGRRVAPWSDGQKEMDINNCILKSHPDCTGDKLFYIIPYFCGQDIMCQKPSQDSLYQAKIHVMQNYLVVGFLEDFTGMLKVLEKILPKFFNGSSDIWKNISEDVMNHTSTLKKTKINDAARLYLKEKMKYEYDFYNFVKAHFRLLKTKMGIHGQENMY